MKEVPFDMRALMWADGLLVTAGLFTTLAEACARVLNIGSPNILGLLMLGSLVYTTASIALFNP